MANQDYFVPSEVARLILGYLRERNFHKSFNTFLRECPDLTEYWQLLRAGKNPATTILGHGLTEILNEFAKFKLTALASCRTENHLVQRPEQTVALESEQIVQADVQACLDAEIREKSKKDKKRVSDQKRDWRRSSENRRKIHQPGKRADKSLTLPKPNTQLAATGQETSTLGTRNALKSSQLVPEVSQDSHNSNCLAGNFYQQQQGETSLGFSLTKATGEEIKKSEEQFDFLDKLLENTQLHEKLAANINKALHNDDVGSGYSSDTSQVAAATSSHVHSQPKLNANTKDININQVIAMTESDPAFQNFLKLFQHASAVPISQFDVTDIEIADINSRHSFDTPNPHKETLHIYKERVSKTDCLHLVGSPSHGTELDPTVKSPILHTNSELTDIDAQKGSTSLSGSEMVDISIVAQTNDMLSFSEILENKVEINGSSNADICGQSNNLLLADNKVQTKAMNVSSILGVPDSHNHTATNESSHLSVKTLPNANIQQEAIDLSVSGTPATTVPNELRKECSVSRADDPIIPVVRTAQQDLDTNQERGASLNSASPLTQSGVHLQAFEHGISYPNAVLVEPMGVLIDKCLSECLSVFTSGGVDSEDSLRKKTQELWQRNIRAEQQGTEQSNQSNSDKVSKSLGHCKKIEKNNEATTSQTTLLLDSDISNDRHIDIHIEGAMYSVKGQHSDSCISASPFVTLSSPPFSSSHTSDDNSPRKLAQSLVKEPTSYSLPASLSHLKLEPSEHQSAFTQVKNYDPINRERNLATQLKRTVISVHSEHVPFIPHHCRKRPSRRIRPTNLMSSHVPSLLGLSSTPSVQITQELLSPQPQTLAQRECAQKSLNINTSHLESLGIKLPPSPSQRKPRRIKTVQLSSKVNQGCSKSSTSSKVGQSSPTMDDAKIVSSSSDFTASQSEVEAFRMLSMLTSSYTKPQPRQEITSTNELLCCSCETSQACKHHSCKSKSIIAHKCKADQEKNESDKAGNNLKSSFATDPRQDTSSPDGSKSFALVGLMEFTPSKSDGNKDKSVDKKMFKVNKDAQLQNIFNDLTCTAQQKAVHAHNDHVSSGKGQSASSINKLQLEPSGAQQSPMLNSVSSNLQTTAVKCKPTNTNEQMTSGVQEHETLHSMNQADPLKSSPLTISIDFQNLESVSLHQTLKQASNDSVTGVACRNVSSAHITTLNRSTPLSHNTADSLPLNTESNHGKELAKNSDSVLSKCLSGALRVAHNLDLPNQTSSNLIKEPENWQCEKTSHYEGPTFFPSSQDERSLLFQAMSECHIPTADSSSVPQQSHLPETASTLGQCPNVQLMSTPVQDKLNSVKKGSRGQYSNKKLMSKMSPGSYKPARILPKLSSSSTEMEKLVLLNQAFNFKPILPAQMSPALNKLENSGQVCASPIQVVESNNSTVITLPPEYNKLFQSLLGEVGISNQLATTATQILPSVNVSPSVYIAPSLNVSPCTGQVSSEQKSGRKQTNKTKSNSKNPKGAITGSVVTQSTNSVAANLSGNQSLATGQKKKVERKRGNVSKTSNLASVVGCVEKVQSTQLPATEIKHGNNSQQQPVQHAEPGTTDHSHELSTGKHLLKKETKKKSHMGYCENGPINTIHCSVESMPDILMTAEANISLSQDINSSIKLYRSPAKCILNTSPGKNKVSESPIKRKVLKSPSKCKDTKSPRKSKVLKSPRKSKVSSAPRKSKDSISPTKSKDSISPTKSKVTKSPRKSKVSKSPRKSKVSHKSIVEHSEPIVDMCNTSRKRRKVEEEKTGNGKRRKIDEQNKTPIKANTDRDFCNISTTSMGHNETDVTLVTQGLCKTVVQSHDKRNTKKEISSRECIQSSEETRNASLDQKSRQQLNVSIHESNDGEMILTGEHYSPQMGTSQESEKSGHAAHPKFIDVSANKGRPSLRSHCASMQASCKGLDLRDQEVLRVNSQVVTHGKPGLVYVGTVNMLSLEQFFHLPKTHGEKQNCVHASGDITNSKKEIFNENSKEVEAAVLSISSIMDTECGQIQGGQANAHGVPCPETGSGVRLPVMMLSSTCSAYTSPIKKHLPPKKRLSLETMQNGQDCGSDSSSLISGLKPQANFDCNDRGILLNQPPTRQVSEQANGELNLEQNPIKPQKHILSMEIPNLNSSSLSKINKVLKKLHKKKKSPM